MMAQFTQWLFNLFKEVFSSLWDFLGDVFISIADLVLSALAAAIAAIPAPDFLANNSLGGLFGMMPDYVRYFLGALNIGQCFAVVGAGFAFRMIRKAVTLFQW